MKKIPTWQTELEQLIFEMIYDLNDGFTDDIFQEAVQDPDMIADAVDFLIEKLENYKENGEF